MLRRFAVISAAAVVLLVCEDRATGPMAAETAATLLKSTEPAEFCLRPDLTYAEQAAQRGGAQGALAVPADWPGKDVPGGDVPPTRIVADPYPTFDGIAVDPENGLVVMSDENRSGLFMYDRAGGRERDRAPCCRKHACVGGRIRATRELTGAAMRSRPQLFCTTSAARAAPICSASG